MDIFETVREIVANQLSVDQAGITYETTFQDVDADSLDVVEVIMSIETTFDIELPDEAVEKFRNVGELSAFVQQQLH